MRLLSTLPPLLSEPLNVSFRPFPQPTPSSTCSPSTSPACYSSSCRISSHASPTAKAKHCARVQPLTQAEFVPIMNKSVVTRRRRRLSRHEVQGIRRTGVVDQHVRSWVQCLCVRGYHETSNGPGKRFSTGFLRVDGIHWHVYDWSSVGQKCGDRNDQATCQIRISSPSIAISKSSSNGNDH